MATPTTPERRLLAAGVKKAATWRTAVALGAGNEILVKGISGLVHARDYFAGQYADTPFNSSISGILGDVKPVSVTLTGDLFYGNGEQGMLMALLFGTAGTPTAQGATAAYLHILQWKDVIDGLFCTLAAEFPGAIYEVASLKISEVVIKVSGGKVQYEIKGTGNTCIDSSAVNAATQMDALTQASIIARPVVWSNVSIKTNVASGGDVTSETALTVNDFELSFKRPIDSEQVAGADNIVEPIENGFPEIGLKLKFPRFAAENKGFQAIIVSGVLQKALVAMTSPTLAATGYPYSWKFYFPCLRIVSQLAPWEEIVKNDVEFVAEQAAASPTGMSYTRPYVEIINTRTTDYLT